MSTSPVIAGSTSTLRPMLRLAVPVLIEQLLSMLVGFSDTILTGRFLDTPHLAAMNLINYLLWLLTSLFAFVGVGATAMTARFTGAGDRATARRVANQAFLLGAALALALVIALGLGGPYLPELAQLEGRAAGLAARYLVFLVPVVPLMMCDAVGIACLRGAGDMVAGLVAMTLVNVVNTALSFALVSGVGPFPRLGWDGLAIGTAVGHLLGGLLILGMLLANRAGLKLSLAELRYDRVLSRRVLRIGLPAGFDAVLVVICHLVYVTIINQLGNVAAAAHGVAIRIESLAYLPGTAFQLAAMTLVGQYLGARQPRQAARSVATCCLWGGGLMAAAALFYGLEAERLARLFIRPEQSEVIALTAELLQIVAIAVVPLALIMIINGALRGAGDTRWPFAVNMLGLIGVRLPAAWLLAHVLGFGVVGAYYAMITDLAVRAVVVVYRYLHGGWQQIDV